MSSSTPTRKYSAGNGPRPGFHRQVTAFFDGQKGHCGHSDDGGLSGRGDDDQDGHGGLRPWFNAMSVLCNMIVVSMVGGNERSWWSQLFWWPK